MPPRFDGKVVWITGAAGGIGAACARRILDEGGSVFLTDREAEALDAVAASMHGGDRVATRVVDVTDAETCSEAVAAAMEAFGRLDSLITSAGVGKGGPATTLPELLWDEVLAINLKGTFLASQAAAPELLKTRGSIVNLASVAGLLAAPGMAAYGSSKAGVIQLTRILALEWAPSGVRVNAVCPTWVDTPMLQEALKMSEHPRAALKQMVARVPMGRVATADEVAAAVAFLISDDALFITGVALPVDGGTLCQ